MTIPALRTPDGRFEELSNWPYAPHYAHDLPGFPGLRMHFVDEGARDAPVFLCLHGEPTWGYLYRKMAPVFLAAGGRVILPDFFGFGRSDKPTDDATYTVEFHRRSLLALIARLELENVTLVVQDWGGLIGLTLPLDAPRLFRRLLVMNTMFPDGSPPSEGFLQWREFARSRPDMEVGKVVARGAGGLTAAEIAAYDAPFPDSRFKAGVRRFPQLVPVETEGGDARAMAWGRDARRWWKTAFAGQSFAAVGMADPVLGPPVMADVMASIRGCPAPMEIADAGHFVQEWGDPIARAALAAWGAAQ